MARQAITKPGLKVGNNNFCQNWSGIELYDTTFLNWLIFLGSATKTLCYNLRMVRLHVGTASEVYDISGRPAFRSPRLLRAGFNYRC